MNLREKVRKIRFILDELYPEPQIPLHYTSHYTLLIAVLLSAQCTDKRVNQVTPLLFAKAATPEAMVKLTVKEIAQIIHPCGLAPTKAKSIWTLSRFLLERFKGQVPSDFESLESLPGVGHKTASVVLSQGFHISTFPVDTHIHRLAKRWGLSSGKNVKTTETDLKKLFPKNQWNRIHLQMIAYGREFCKARAHDPALCPICSAIL